MGYPNERINGWNNIFTSSPLANPKIGPSGSQSLLLFTITGRTPLPAYRPIKSSLVTRPPSFHLSSTRQTIRLPLNALNRCHQAESRPPKQSTSLDIPHLLHPPHTR